MQLPLSKKQDSQEKHLELQYRLSKIYAESGRAEDAIKLLQDALSHDNLPEQFRLEMLCSLVDLQVKASRLTSMTDNLQSYEYYIEYLGSKDVTGGSIE